MTSSAFPHLTELETLRGRPALLYAATINDDGLRTLYEYFRQRKRVDALDLVLSTTGGLVTVARQMAVLLREYTAHLTILVPYRAWSAGTLLCLSANELVLGPMAELSPIDPQIGVGGPPPPDAPGMIAAPDIHAFRQMAQEWFGVYREEDQLQVLALVAQRIFPTSISSFYRADRMVRRIANDLLAYQLPTSTAQARDQIIEQLVGGFYTHNYPFSRAELRAMGLQVRDAEPSEETCLWACERTCRTRIAQSPGRAEREVTGLMAASGFYASEIREWITVPAWHEPGASQWDIDVHWEVEGE